MTTPGFARNLNTLYDDNPGASAEDQEDEYLNRQIEIEENSWDAYRNKRDIESARRDALQDKLDKAMETDSVAARFINPRPELGCLYYDENNVRHWFPHCHEL